MIEFTIKTLDSNNHHFTVDDDITVQQLKIKVREKLGIEIHLQRLIFCGRVLQDDKPLKDYDIQGKVVHLVQRAPPDQRHPHTSSSSGAASGTASRTAAASNNAAGERGDRSERNVTGNGMQQQIRRLMALTGQRDLLGEQQQQQQQQQSTSMTPTTGRLEFIRRTIVEIKTSLAQLRAHMNDEEISGVPASSADPVEPMDIESTPDATREEPVPILDENGDEVADQLVRAQNSRRRSYRAIRALRARNCRPRDLAQLIEELDCLQEQFTPYRVNYTRLLRSASEPEPPQYTAEEREHNQTIVDTSCDIMHSFSHAYHAVSDINFQVGRHGRLTAEALPMMRHPIPLQAQINVVQSGATRRPAQQQGNNDGTGNRASERPTGNETNSSSRGENQDHSRSPSAPLAGRNTTQPTVNINIQPDPITYQVEIETRVPIAFPIENALFTGLANALNTNNSQPTEQNQQNQSQNQGAAQGQANRRQVLDLENFFRNSLGGVEVVMSMDDIISTGAATGIATGVTIGGSTDGATGAATGATAGGAARAASGAATDGEESMQTFDGVFVAQLPWAGQPAVEILQNIMASVIRQGAITAPGFTVQMPSVAQVIESDRQAHAAVNLDQAANGQAANAGRATATANSDVTSNSGHLVDPVQAATQGQATTRNQAATQDRAASQHATLGHDQAARRTRAAGIDETAQPNRSQSRTQDSTTNTEQTQSEQGQGAAGAQQRQQPTLQQRRAAAARGQAISFNNIIYDRFLPCDSLYSRRRLQRRREQQQAQAAVQERMRTDRAAAVNITALQERNSNITQRFMDTMVTLLHAEPSRETWYNAVMIAVARNLFLPEPIHMMAGQTSLIPSEFQALRRHLRSFIQHILTVSGGTHGDNSYQEVADFLVDDQTMFINGVRVIAPMVSDVDVMASLRNMVRSRLPAVITSVMSETPGESFAPRFYGVFYRFFTDLCALISVVCRDGSMGLRVIYTAFIEEILNHFRGNVHDALLAISIDNLNGVLPNLRLHGNNVRQFIQQRPRASQLNPTNDGSIPLRRPSPMELSPSPPVRDEPMLSSPQAIHLEAERDETPYQVDMSPLAPGNLIPTSMPPRHAMSTMPMMSTLPDLPMSSPMSPHTTAPVHASTSADNERAAAATPVATSAATPAATHAATPTATPAATPAATPSTDSSRASSRASKPTKPDMTITRTTTDPPTNLQLVSPMMILQHWGEEWVPVFTRDQQTQREEPREPYSDAYLSGMPSRKRRCLRQARPPTTLDGFMNESVREAAERPTNMDNSAIRTAFREHMRNMARNRATNSDDYDPLRYASAARFLNPSRSSKQQQPESSSEQKD